MRQSYLHEYVGKSCVPRQVEAHRDQVPLYHGYGVERRSEAPVRGNRRADNRCVDQASRQSEVRVLQRKTWCDPKRDLSKEGVMCSSISKETGYLSVTSWQRS